MVPTTDRTDAGDYTSHISAKARTSSNNDIKPTMTTMLPVATFPPQPLARTTSGALATKRKSTSAETQCSSSMVAVVGQKGTGKLAAYSGIRPVERQLMRPWMEKKIDSGEVSGLEWVDAGKTRFKVPWKHGSSHGWKHDTDACLFMQWALHTGRYKTDDPPNPKRWKANFRCAINSLPDVREVKEASQTRGQNAYRVYEFTAERKPRPSSARNAAKKVGLTTKTKLCSPTTSSSTQAPTTQGVPTLHNAVKRSCSPSIMDQAFSTPGHTSIPSDHASATTDHACTATSPTSTARLVLATTSATSIPTRPSPATTSHASISTRPTSATAGHTSISTHPTSATTSHASISTDAASITTSHASITTGPTSLTAHHCLPAPICDSSLFSSGSCGTSDVAYVKTEPSAGSCSDSRAHCNASGHSPGNSSVCHSPTHTAAPHNTTDSAAYSIPDEWFVHSENMGYQPAMAFQPAAHKLLPACSASPGQTHSTLQPCDVTKTQPDVITLPATFAASPASLLAPSSMSTISSPSSSFTSQTLRTTQSFPIMTSQTPFTPQSASSSSPLPNMTLDLVVRQHLDSDSGIGSPSSPGSTTAYSDIDHRYVDDFSDTSSDAPVGIPDLQDIMETLYANTYDHSGHLQQQIVPNAESLGLPLTDNLPDNNLSTQASNYTQPENWFGNPEMYMEIEYLIKIKSPSNDPYNSTIESTVSAQIQPQFSES